LREEFKVTTFPALVLKEATKEASELAPRVIPFKNKLRLEDMVKFVSSNALSAQNAKEENSI